uniref:Uncharacterized protein n=1 Tax=Cacopsylla melanoneura TaxID=428564 RepID=A0A8D8VAJ5_9HEMI
MRSESRKRGCKCCGRQTLIWANPHISLPKCSITSTIHPVVFVLTLLSVKTNLLMIIRTLDTTPSRKPTHSWAGSRSRRLCIARPIFLHCLEGILDIKTRSPTLQIWTG